MTAPLDPAVRAARAAARRATLDARMSATLNGPLVCPECRAHRTTLETLRVHRWLAHDVRTAP